MKKIFMIFAIVAIFSVSGCWKNTYPKPEAFNDADDTESVSGNDADESEDSESLPDNDSTNATDTNTVPDEDIFDPCETNPCIGIEHSTEECFAKGYNYKCGCEGEYFWYDSACVLNVCETMSCAGLENSTGECIPRGHNYICQCEEDFFWYENNDSACILSPCKGNPCNGKENSSGECVPLTSDKYECKCLKNHYWSENACIPSPCKTETCKDIENATGECIILNKNEYSCRCKTGFFWNGEKCNELPECAQRGKTPCRDSSTGLMWSSKYSDDWHLNKCYYDITEGGFTDWRTPTISQLRTLIQNCPNTETGGMCEVYDNCRDEITCGEKCDACEKSSNGKYNKFGDTGLFWSGSTNNSGQYAYGVNFNNAALEFVCDMFASWLFEIDNDPRTTYECGNFNIRCTRCDEGYFWDKDKCVKSPCTQESCDIPHSNRDWCIPQTETTYSCECEHDYFWNGFSCVLSPCADKPCELILYAQWCLPESETTFTCSCNNNHAWDEKQKRCVNPCESNPCKMPHADGTCYTQTAESYRCGCEENYKWNSEEQKCVKKE